jgi:spermidine synthase
MAKVLEDFQSPINGRIRVERMLGFGTVLRAGNLTQSGGIIYDIWKKTFKKVQAEKVEVSNVLILGLAGGTLVKLIRKFWDEDVTITGVDVDPLMVEMGKKHLGLKEDEVEIVISDATQFCKKMLKQKSKYDLIFIDMYNGDIFPEQFEEMSFLEMIQRLLSPDGIAVFNRLYYGDKRKLAVKFSAKLSKVFSTNEAVYPEANVMFVCRK